VDGSATSAYSLLYGGTLLARDPEERLNTLEWQLAQLTSRVHRLEQLLSSGLPVQQPTPAASERPSQEAVSARSDDSLAEPPARTAQEHQPAAPSPFPPVAAGKPYPYAPPATRRTSSSFESIVGGQWLNRLGIVAVLVGLSYFLKLAFENDWIGPATRVLIGLAVGIALLPWSEHFRRRGFPAFGYSLKAVGIGALYMSLWAAFQFYHLIPATVAFVGMVLVTLTSASLALTQDAELLSAFALVGGFLTPVLISTRQNQEVSLMLYLLLLDLGTFCVAAAKGWKRLLPGAFAGTALLFAGWAASYYSDRQLRTTVLFATMFFVSFAAAPIVGKADPGEAASFRQMIQALVVVNAVAYFAALFLMMEVHNRNMLAWLTFAVAACYLALSRVLMRQSNAAGWEPLHVALSIAFLTACIPIAFDGRWITFTWDLEAALLLWLALRSGRRLLRLSSTAVLAMSMVRLVVADSGQEATLLFNPRFGLFLLTIAVSAFLVYVLLRRDGQESRQLAGGAVIAINLLTLLALNLEVQDYFRPQLQSALGEALRGVQTIEAFTYSALWMLYGTALMLVGFWKREAFFRWQAIVLLAITAVKVFFFDIATLQRGYRIAAFIVLGVVLLGVSFFYQRTRVSATER
jgi:uncharacterized membrane protein